METGKVIKFLIYWIVASTILNLSGSVFGNNVHLGNALLLGSVAAVINGLILTGLYYQIPTIVKRLKFKIEKENRWVMAFFVANAITIWLMKALAIITGLGISNILLVLVVAAFVTAGQRLTDRLWIILEVDRFPTLLK